MNAEVVTALAVYIAHDGEPDATTIKSALAEMKQEIQYLRETLGWGEYKPHHQPAHESEQAERFRSLKEEADAVSARVRAVEDAVERQTKKKPVKAGSFLVININLPQYQAQPPASQAATQRSHRHHPSSRRRRAD
jgi:hypothetical protein